MLLLMHTIAKFEDFVAFNPVNLSVALCASSNFYREIQIRHFCPPFCCRLGALCPPAPSPCTTARNAYEALMQAGQGARYLRGGGCAADHAQAHAQRYLSHTQPSLLLSVSACLSHCLPLFFLSVSPYPCVCLSVCLSLSLSRSLSIFPSCVYIFFADRELTHCRLTGVAELLMSPVAHNITA